MTRKILQVLIKTIDEKNQIVHWNMDDIDLFVGLICILSPLVTIFIILRLRYLNKGN